MPVLKNAKHERFAQGLAEGMTATDAYLFAGYNTTVKQAGNSAARLRENPVVMARVVELLQKRQKIEEAATAKAVEKLAISKEKVLRELMKIGFSDLRRAVKWRSSLIEEKDNPDGGDVLITKTIVTNTVELVPSEDLDDDTACAIKSIKQAAHGGVSIELYDKRAALVDIGKELGMWAGGSSEDAKDAPAADAPKHPGTSVMKDMASRFRRGLGVIDGGKKAANG